MKITDFTNMSAASAKKIVKELNVYLASLYVYNQNLHGYHWHVEGELFMGVHKQTEEYYDEVFEQIDEVAERILQLDGVPVRKFAEVTKISKIAEADVPANPRDILMAILETLKTLTAMERALITLAGELDDEVTVGIITEYLTNHEKYAWMLKATLAGKK